MPPRIRRADDDTSAADVSAPDANGDPRAAEVPDVAPDTAPEAKPNGTEYLNVTNGPIVFDKDGHQVGGGEWTPPIHLDAIGKVARANDYLLPRSAL